MRKIAKVFVLFTGSLLIAGVLNGCGAGGTESNDSTVAATVNGHSILLKEVERAVTQQAGGQQSKLSALELAQARLQVLSNLVQREVLFQRAEREKLLPTEDEIDGAINTQKQQSGMTAEDFERRLKEQNMSMETLREESRNSIMVVPTR